MILLIICNGCACALTMKAAIGIGAWDAMAQTFSNITTIKVGTMGIIFNCSCVLGELIILKRKFTFKHFLQVIVSFLFGFVVNFIFYNVLTFEINSYILRLLAFVLAYVGMAIFVGGIMVLNVVTFALEGFCKELSNITPFEFSKIRQTVDIVCIILTLILCFTLSLPLVIREGTVIGMIIYSPILKQAMIYETKLFKKLNIID
jgi:uncharacterized membrane protein YczE